MTRRRRWITWLAVTSGVMTTLLLAAATRIPFSSETLRKKVVAALAERLDAEVELQDVTLHFSPRLHAAGTGLRVHYHGRRDVPPLISVERFTIDATFMGLWRRHVSHVTLEGLVIQIPPKDDTGVSARPHFTDIGTPEVDDGSYGKHVVIDQVDAPDAQLIIRRRDPAKPPRIWHLHELHLQSAGLYGAIPYQTVLTNAVPPGRIAAQGSFGPWQREDPGLTPLDGRFTYDDADLSVFKGISGMLSANGMFEGALERIDIHGVTDTPDFMVNISGNPVALHTTYHAIVDATNGNTTLEQVDASFLRSKVVAKGGVYETPGHKGRQVTLDVTVDEGRLEDMMRLAVKAAKAPMTGDLRLRTTLVLPPGDIDVVEKLRLDGRFAIESGRFTDPGVQNKVVGLSKRASTTDRSEAALKQMTSNFAGRFKLGDGRLALTPVTFNVPGAVVELTGAYGMRAETIGFDGQLYMDAKISETVDGFKSLLLKIIDPLFRKDGRTTIPLKIGGTRKDPQFGVDFRRVVTRDQVPAQRTSKPRSPDATKKTPPTPPPSRPFVSPARVR